MIRLESNVYKPDLNIRVNNITVDGEINAVIRPDNIEPGEEDEVLTVESGEVVWRPLSGGGGVVEVFNTTYQAQGSIFDTTPPLRDIKFIKSGINCYIVISPFSTSNEDLKPNGICDLILTDSLPAEFINSTPYFMPLKVTEPESPSRASTGSILIFNSTTLYTYNPRTSTRTWIVTSGDFAILSQIVCYCIV